MPNSSKRYFRGFDIQKGLRLVLVLQAVIAAALIVGDLVGRWKPSVPSDLQKLTGPVEPGDQVRRFEPDRLNPRPSSPSTPTEVNLPEKFPERLSFQIVDEGDLGPLLLLNGEIETGDSQRLQSYIADLKDVPGRVALNSPGGKVEEALAIGRLLRKLEKDTVILEDMVCLSSCPYVLAGGIERQVSGRGLVGLHQHYYDQNLYIPAYFAVQQIQRGQGRTMSYLVEMGIDVGIMVHSLETPPDDIYVLVKDELMDSRLATKVFE